MNPQLLEKEEPFLGLSQQKESISVLGACTERWGSAGRELCSRNDAPCPQFWGCLACPQATTSMAYGDRVKPCLAWPLGLCEDAGCAWGEGCVEPRGPRG